jgi:hypothetical protein
MKRVNNQLYIKDVDLLLNFEGAEKGGPAIIALLKAMFPNQTSFTAQCTALVKRQF